MTYMPDLPEHVRSAVAPREDRAPSEWSRSMSSPYQPYESNHYKVPTAQWLLLYGPIAFLLVAAFAVLEPWVALLAAAPHLTVLYRGPQEWLRRGGRGWTRDEHLNTWRWSDASEEWRYSRYQGHVLPRLLRGLVVLASPALTYSWTQVAEQYDTTATFIALMWTLAVLAYVHRHLPTPLRRSETYRWCASCHERRPEDAAPIHPRCGRVSKVRHFAALPSLRRSWANL